MHRHSTLSPRGGPFAVALSALAGCHSAPAGGPTPSAAVRFEAADPRRCLPTDGGAPGRPDLARACAEAFVLSNGYTARRAPADTTLLVREPFEIGGWNLLRDTRRYTIEPKAVFAECDATGCIVLFRRFVRNRGCLAASMSGEYSRLQFGRPAETVLVRSSAATRCA